MKMGRTYFVLYVLLIVAAALPAAAQLLIQPFDAVLEGDDPGKVFPVDLPYDPATPVVVRFEGFFQNLDTGETGVRWGFWWSQSEGGGTEGFTGISFARLPGSGTLPVQFERWIGYTPDTLFLHVEGGGPADHFLFSGEMTIQQVPEPGVWVVMGLAGIVALARVLATQVTSRGYRYSRDGDE